MKWKLCSPKIVQEYLQELSMPKTGINSDVFKQVNRPSYICKMKYYLAIENKLLVLGKRLIRSK
jgi:hypothetical protein